MRILFLASVYFCVYFLCKCFMATYKVMDAAKSWTVLLQPRNLHKCIGELFSQEVDFRIDLKEFKQN